MSLDLDAIEARANAALEEPCNEQHGVFAECLSCKSDVLQSLRTDVPALIARVRELEAQVAASKPDAFDFMAHLQRQREWSGRTFGPGDRVKGVIDHIRKELVEIEAAPRDLSEWIDVILLAIDGAWRSGATPGDIIAALAAKQAKNEARAWPDWRTADPNKAIEHDRSAPDVGLVDYLDPLEAL